jgi:hypothetical protein
VLEEYQALGYPVLSIRSIPKDPKWLARFFKDDLEREFTDNPLSVGDVWPENYSTNSVQKVWAAKFAARHPNVVVLDLSNFKCGHDAPIYGLIDNIVNSSGTPYSALHDIDATKPGGSIKIRVKTYSHTLNLHEEKLGDESAKMTELQKSVEAKRQELLKARRIKLQEAIEKDPKARRELEDFEKFYEDYLEEEIASQESSEEDLRRQDIAPLPAEETVIKVRESHSKNDPEAAESKNSKEEVITA